MSEACNHDCGHCSSNCSEREGGTADFSKPVNEYSRVGKVIAVLSGKGGVGKSSVTSLLAKEMASRGYKVGILDADITGPSIPQMFGVHGNLAGDDRGIQPAETETGIKIVSINLLLERETAPVVWRGPVIAGAVTQFWTDVCWGDVDYMFVDMPPGTGDVPLTVFQSLPVDGAVIVSSPQQLVGMIVEKCVNMAGMMNKNVVGLVENLAYFRCPDCGKEHNLFGESHVEEIAARYGIPVTDRLPIDPSFAAACDAGCVEDYAAASPKAVADAIEKL